MANKKIINPVDTAIDLWRSGVRSVDARRLIQDYVRVDGDRLAIGDQRFGLADFDRIRVVGAGKVAGVMGEALEDALGPNLMVGKNVSGLVNVPYGKYGGRISTGSRVWQFPARPAGENLPTAAAFGATLLIEDLVERAGSRELCFCLLSGGASALLTHPPKKVKLQDKRKLIQWLSRSGASIQQINTVRKHVSDVKGGRLAARFKGFHMVCLSISDVIGNQPGLIGSGPTVADSSTPEDALAILSQIDPKLRHTPVSIQRHLKRTKSSPVDIPDNVTNHIIGHLEQAIEQTMEFGLSQGFHCLSEIQTDEFETVETAGRRLGQWVLDQLKRRPGKPQVIISGGEPVIEVAANPGTGGRNSHLVLTALQHLLDSGIDPSQPFALLAGGTDGEDGNAPAAGAWISNQSLARVQQMNLNPASFLRSHNAHQFFARLGCGIFHGLPQYRTNVSDLRIGYVGAEPPGGPPAKV
ncbi:MAG: DUF4147 domain-containing protein [Mariniblastus sp.]|nr:DUF4147 domain-containing protein [Mariniblastus sp.]